MNKTLGPIVMVALIFLLTYANAKMPWNGEYAVYQGGYLLYSRELGDMQPPTRRDQKVSFMVEGRIAREMFESMAPDLKFACGSSLRLRVRNRGDVDCSFETDNHASPYTCYFGFNLNTGKSITGATC